MKPIQITLECKSCGESKHGKFTKEQIADWLREHSAARLIPTAMKELNDAK
jgi:hypothetical protein